MSENTANELIIGKKNGVPIYEANPSIPKKSNNDLTSLRKVKVGNDVKGFVIDGVGEVVGSGAVGFYEFQEVDKTQFVKFYLEGIRQAVGLSKSGLAIFEVIYLQIQHSPNSDKVELNYHLISKNIAGLTERTYQRGVRELLDKEFIYRSPSDGLFFVNIRYLFNGDRLAFVKGYQLKQEFKQVNIFED